MSEVLQIMFPLQSVEIRVVKDGDELWFVGKDVCDALGLANSRDALSRLDADEKSKQVCGVQIMDTTSRTTIDTSYSCSKTSVGKSDTCSKIKQKTQQLLCVNESGLYHLIFTSNKPEAQAFRKWVTGEVLPALRKTGRYELGAAPVPEVPEMVLVPGLKNTGMPDKRHDDAPANVTIPAGVVDMRAALMNSNSYLNNRYVKSYYALGTVFYALGDLLRALELWERYDEVVHHLLDAGLRPGNFLCFGMQVPELFVTEYMAQLVCRHYIRRMQWDYGGGYRPTGGYIAPAQSYIAPNKQEPPTSRLLR